MRRLALALVAALAIGLAVPAAASAIEVIIIDGPGPRRRARRRRADSGRERSRSSGRWVSIGRGVHPGLRLDPLPRHAVQQARSSCEQLRLGQGLAAVRAHSDSTGNLGDAITFELLALFALKNGDEAGAAEHVLDAEMSLEGAVGRLGQIYHEGSKASKRIAAKLGKALRA